MFIAGGPTHEGPNGNAVMQGIAVTVFDRTLHNNYLNSITYSLPQRLDRMPLA
jgi:hypothetical protein